MSIPHQINTCQLYIQRVFERRGRAEPICATKLSKILVPDYDVIILQSNSTDCPVCHPKMCDLYHPPLVISTWFMKHDVHTNTHTLDNVDGSLENTHEMKH